MLDRLKTVKNLAYSRGGSAVRRHLDEADEARMRRADEKKAKRAARLRHAPRAAARLAEQRARMTDAEVEDHKAMIAAGYRNRAWTRGCVKRRLEVGYEFPGGVVGGELQERFTFRGLKSDDHPILKAFVATLPRARKGLGVGMTKAFLEEVDWKVLGLDAPYVGGNKKVLGWVRVDLDTLFASWGHLQDELLDCLGDGRLMPHVATGYVRPNGKVVRPHLLFMLPYGNGIRTGEGARVGPQALFRAVARALYHALAPLGADSGGLANLLRTKNPLSPHWGTAIMNEADPLSLRDLADLLGPLPSADDVERRAAAVRAAEQGGTDEAESNAAFTYFRRVAFEAMCAWHAAGDRRLTLDRRDDLATALYRALEGEARAMPKPKPALATLRCVCRHTALRFDPSRIQGARPGRGALRDQLRGVDDLRARQRAGAAHTARQRRDRTVAAIVAALNRAGGPDAGTTTIARVATLPLRTVQRNWREAVNVFASREAATAQASAGCATRCLVKRPGHPRPSQPRDRHTATSADRHRVRLPRQPEQRPHHPVRTPSQPGTTVIPPGLGPLGRIRIVPPPEPSGGRRSPPPVPSFLRHRVLATEKWRAGG
jgi:hypothetical protein